MAAIKSSVSQSRQVRVCTQHVAGVLLSIVMLCTFARSADVVLVRPTNAVSLEQRQLEIASRFYGLGLSVIDVDASDFDAALDREASRKDTLAVVIEAKALGHVNQRSLFHVLHRKTGTPVPLLICGITPETGSITLQNWSAGVAIAGKTVGGTLHYRAGASSGLTRQIANLTFTFSAKNAFYLAVAQKDKAQVFLSVDNGQDVFPTFIEANVRQERVFLLSRSFPESEIELRADADDTVGAFAKVAPLIMFVSYCAGEQGWHSTQHYANLTIDDPWLREPYGFLNYKDLLKEMQEHNFHTTIAFIPWNYDRSEARVVALFRNHPERYSICIHGDNHDHKEFDDFKSKAFSLQIAAVGQSLARMEEFQRLTGIPYDHVFVFPHNIGSESILKQLKIDNFTATINSLNVPINQNPPSSLLFALRPVTLSFAGFPSIARFSPSMQDRLTFIAINGFLDNPVLFYTHHDFFASGIDAFDGVADQVNKIQPNTRWRSVGDIAKHLYLVRLRGDSEYDVRAFSNDLELNNTFGRDSVFYIQRPESDPAAIALVSVDGRRATYQVDSGILQVMVKIPAGESRHVVVRYKNDLDLVSVSISKSSLRVYFLRTVSDFRDISLSKFSAGRTVIAYYYGGKMSLLTIILCGSVVIVFGICTTWGFLLIVKRKNTAVLVPSRRSR
jgi:hypothetical protein